MMGAGTWMAMRLPPVTPQGAKCTRAGDYVDGTRHSNSSYQFYRYLEIAA